MARTSLHQARLYWQCVCTDCTCAPRLCVRGESVCRVHSCHTSTHMRVFPRHATRELCTCVHSRVHMALCTHLCPCTHTRTSPCEYTHVPCTHTHVPCTHTHMYLAHMHAHVPLENTPPCTHTHTRTHNPCTHLHAHTPVPCTHPCTHMSLCTHTRTHIAV